MAIGGRVRGYRPGIWALRNERDVAMDPDREAKLLAYQAKALAGVPLFEKEPATPTPKRKRTRSAKRR
jgi:hypothetical protein